MKERPILFSAPMVRAILEGRKTQTRRIVKPQPEYETTAQGVRWYRWRGVGMTDTGGIQKCLPPRSPYGQPGDRLWSRETWRVGAWDEDEGKIAVDYRADNYARREWIDPSPDDDGEVFNRLWEQSCEDCSGRVRPDDEGRYHWKPGESPCRWRPSIFMPRAASRITLEVIGVRVERLQEITEADAIAEGIDGPLCAKFTTKSPAREHCLPAAVHAYFGLFESINGAGSWESNPWVWVISFQRLKEQ